MAAIHLKWRIPKANLSHPLHTNRPSIHACPRVAFWCLLLYSLFFYFYLNHSRIYTINKTSHPLEGAPPKIPRIRGEEVGGIIPKCFPTFVFFCFVLVSLVMFSFNFVLINFILKSYSNMNKFLFIYCYNVAYPLNTVWI